jgi:hypothetical protein
MSRKQYTPYGSSHEKKLSRKERKKIAKENPIINPEAPMLVSAPTEQDKKQIRSLTLLAVGGLVFLLALMYYIFVSK